MILDLKGTRGNIPVILSRFAGSVISPGRLAIFSRAEASCDAECSSSVNFFINSSGYSSKDKITSAVRR